MSSKNEDAFCNVVDIPEAVTICITSCGRLDLLDRTLKSFQSQNRGGKFIVSEDSADNEIIAAVKKRIPEAIVLSGPERLGLMGSIDRLYSVVETPYLFHLEDDWIFDGPVDWEGAILALETHNDIANVTVRAFEEIKPKYRKRSEHIKLDGRTLVHMNRSAHPEFFGWSPNPGLIRTSMYKKYAPFARMNPDQMSGLIKKELGTQAYLLPGVGRHIGHGRNVVDPNAKARPKSKLGKLVRAFKLKLYYAGLRKDPY